MQKKIIPLILVMAFITTLVFSPNIINAKTTKQQLNEVKDELDTKKDSLKDKESTASDLESQIESFDTKISNLTEKINEQEKKQEEIEKELEKSQKELRKAKEKRKEYQDLLSERMEVMYMYGDTGYLDLIFSSESISDLIGKVSTVKSLVSYDQSIVNELQKVENEINTKTEKIAKDKKELEKVIADLTENKESLDTLRVAKNAELTNVNGDIDDLNAEIAKLEAKKAELDSEIAAQSGSSSNNNYNLGTGKGALGWPTPGNYYITSYFGYRDQPTAGASTNHGAVDIGVSTGTPVLSPGSGVVTYSGWNGGYGYAVSIDCGNIGGDHITVLLAHNSSLAVSTGQKVSRGQVVAYSGSTGISTGPHLHFAVYCNGYAVDPLNYVDI